ncbi:flagellar brake domain-containing protein [Halobacillus salinarum]|uniref:Flagellar brake domain-containing protein n=1 Tax=Halobacillus salinarum TaxID=2932257 RepID=A0ABY4EE03_9BACI|nr:flagellar brake domain-containing protein [Halobacillus salinarum]UOQ42690.1 flagellar brake domain-containing protein [Halobacillus salinarum]
MIKIGTTMNLELFKQDQEEPERYKCTLVDHSQGYIYIDYPIKTNTGRTSFFFEGTRFQVSFVGKDGSVYSFKSEVTARRKLKIPVLVLTFPGKDQVVRIQRRRYVRVETSIDVAIQLNNESEASFTSITQDVSGGGRPFSFQKVVSLSICKT